MTTTMALPEAGWCRRAQPWLGTLVEVGLRLRRGSDAAPAFAAAFAQVRKAQEDLSRFVPESDVGRFNTLRRGERMTMRASMRDVMQAAGELREASGGAFDISAGTSPDGWRCEGDALLKLDDAARLDLGGIAKGYAVDRAVQALVASGCEGGWVNAGGDLRSFGEADVPVHVRDESSGGVRPFATLRDGAFATSHFGAASRSSLAPARHEPAMATHVSVAAPHCLWADALTKIVATSGDAGHPLLARYDAVAWIH